jgi:hypothetical protein
MSNGVNVDFGPGFHGSDPLRGSKGKVCEGFFVGHEAVAVLATEYDGCCWTCFLDPFPRSGRSGRSDRSESIRPGTPRSRILCWSGSFDQHLRAYRTVSFETIGQGKKYLPEAIFAESCNVMALMLFANWNWRSSLYSQKKCGVESDFFHNGSEPRLPRLPIHRNQVNQAHPELPRFALSKEVRSLIKTPRKPSQEERTPPNNELKRPSMHGASNNLSKLRFKLPFCHVESLHAGLSLRPCRSAGTLSEVIESWRADVLTVWAYQGHYFDDSVWE